jgi:HK97 gp10 family phage protein
MASSFSLQVKGLDQLIKKFKEAPKEIVEDLDRAFVQAANTWVNGAVQEAPVFDGKLKGSIRFERAGVLHFTIIAGVFYAPYIEFGTKKKVRVPPGLNEVAAQYKGGTGGSFKDLLASIEKWVRKNNIGDRKKIKSTAFVIAVSIAKNGLKPQPFFFKQMPKAEAIIVNEFKEIQKRVSL